jgi:hypothetical protein
MYTLLSQFILVFMGPAHVHMLVAVCGHGFGTGLALFIITLRVLDAEAIVRVIGLLMKRIVPITARLALLQVPDFTHEELITLLFVFLGEIFLHPLIHEAIPELVVLDEGECWVAL